MVSKLPSLWTEYEQALIWNKDAMGRGEVMRLRAAIEAEIERAAIERVEAQRRKRKTTLSPSADMQKQLDGYRQAVSTAKKALEDV